MNLLSLSIFLPLAGALLVIGIGKQRLAMAIGLAVACLELLLTLAVLWQFNPEDSGFQLLEQYPWMPSLNAEFFLGVDGISVLFLPMTALLTLLAIIASWYAVVSFNRLHLALLLLLEAMTIGVFSALDMLLFLVFWQLTLPPIFFLIGLWGVGAKRRHAAIKYTLFMLFGGVPLLFAIVLLAINHANQINGSLPQDLSFSLPILLQTALPDNLQNLIFLLLLLGFAVKAPLVPLHSWLPSTALEAPTQLVALLLGLKLGIYGIIRFAMPLAPSAAVEFNWLLGILGAITLMYGALIALQQTNLRRLLAFASISHAGLVVIGIAALNMQGIQGAIFQLLNFTIIAGSLMLIAGFFHQRLGSTELQHLGGLAKTMPRLTAFFFLFVAASIGIPGSNGFPAELLLVLGALLGHPSLGITALAGAVLAAAYMLSYSRRAFFGPITCPANQQAMDLLPREIALLTIPALLVLVLGLWPNGVLGINKISTEAWLARLLEQPSMKGEELVELRGMPASN